MDKGEGSKGKGKGKAKGKGKGKAKAKAKAKAKEEEQRPVVAEGIEIGKQPGERPPEEGFEVTLRANSLEELVRCTPRVGDYVLMQVPSAGQQSDHSDLTCVPGQHGYRILNERERLHMAWKTTVEGKTKRVDKALGELQKKTEMLEKQLEDVDRRRAAEREREQAEAEEDELREKQLEEMKRLLLTGDSDDSDDGDGGNDGGSGAAGAEG